MSQAATREPNLRQAAAILPMEQRVIRSLISLSLGLPLLVLAWTLLDPAAARHARHITAFLNEGLYWVTPATATLLLVLLLWLGLGRLGKRPLAELRKPEFGRIAWFSMMLTAGVGSTLVVAPGFSAMPAAFDAGLQGRGMDPDLFFAALTRIQVHWGLHAWAWVLLCASMLGLSMQSDPPSNLLSSRLRGRRSTALEHPVSRAFADLAFILAAVMTSAAALPLTAQAVTGGVEQLTGWSPPAMTTAVLLTASAGAAALAAFAGLRRGIRRAAILSALLLALLTYYVWMAGGALFGAKLVVASAGEYLSALPRLSFATAPFADSTPGANAAVLAVEPTPSALVRWVLMAPLVGAFIARISRGRSVRELLLAGFSIALLVALVWISLIGGIMMRPEVLEGMAQGREALLSFDTWSLFARLPLHQLGMPLALLTAVALLVAMLAAASYALASWTTAAGVDPSPRMRFFWGAALGAIGLAVLLIQGEREMQSAALVAGAATLAAILWLGLSGIGRFRALGAAPTKDALKDTETPFSASV